MVWHIAYDPRRGKAPRIEIPRGKLIDPMIIRECQRLALEQVPDDAILQSNFKQMPNIFSVRALFACDEKFRLLVEELEPNVHQFFPIVIRHYRTNETPPGGPFYLVNIMNCRDDVLIPSLSKATWVPIPESPYKEKGYWSFDSITPSIVLNWTKIQGIHLFRGPTPRPPSMFFSEELMKKFKAAGMWGCLHQQCGEVDV